MRSSRLLPAATVSALLLAACSSGSGGASSPIDSSVGEPAATTAAPAADTSSAAPDTGAEAVVVPAPLQFSAPLVGGGELDVSALAGKPTVFWFWAPT